MQNLREKVSCINILLLSEKEVDKSNFIDAFKGYLTFESPAEALDSNKWFNPEFKEIKDHVLNLRYEKFRFINTEGLCGSNEPEENERCLKQIVSNFAKATQLNSIVFLLSPSVASKKFFELTFGIFKEKFAGNIKAFTFIFMHDDFTIARQYKCSDLLRSLLGDLIDENVFHFNNILRTEACLRDKAEDFTNNGIESVTTYEKLFDYFTGKQLFSVKQFADFQSVIKVIDNLNYLLYDISLVLEDNLKRLRDISAESTTYSLYLLTIQSFGSYVTICKSDKCYQKFQFVNDNINLSKNCHVPCDCPESGCEIFNFKTCSLCQCSIDEHSRVVYVKLIKLYKLEESAINLQVLQPNAVKEQYSINTFYGNTTYNMSMMSKRSKSSSKSKSPEDKTIKIAPLITKYEIDKDYVLNLLATFTAFKKQSKCAYATFLEEKLIGDDSYKELKVQYEKILQDTIKVQITPIMIANYIKKLCDLEIVGEMISPEFFASFAEPTIKLEISEDNSESEQSGIQENSEEGE